MWRLVKHVINILFYPFFIGYTVRQLLPRGKGRKPAGQLLDSVFPTLERNVLRLEGCNRTGVIDENETNMILESYRFYANMRFTDESVVNPTVMFLLFPVRSFRFWQMKRRLASAMKTGTVYELIKEVREKSIHIDSKGK